MAKLFLVRHGKSEWNKLGLWTGWQDPDLAEEGIEEAKKAGENLKGQDIHVAHTSKLKRTHQTFENIRKVIGREDLGYSKYEALNERHYGIHTGKNKWQVKEEVGEEEFKNIRRGWDHKIPEGETLKDVHKRVVPHYVENIKPELAAGKNVLVVASGNSLRALVKELENLDENQVCELELGTGEVHCYHFDENLNIIKKEIKINI